MDHLASSTMVLLRKLASHGCIEPYGHKKIAILLGKGNGKCVNCKQEEDNMHIFMLCKNISALISLFNVYVLLDGGKAR